MAKLIKTIIILIIMADFIRPKRYCVVVDEKYRVSTTIGVGRLQFLIDPGNISSGPQETIDDWAHLFIIFDNLFCFFIQKSNKEPTLRK